MATRLCATGAGGCARTCTGPYWSPASRRAWRRRPSKPSCSRPSCPPTPAPARAGCATLGPRGTRRPRPPGGVCRGHKSRLRAQTDPGQGRRPEGSVSRPRGGHKGPEADERPVAGGGALGGGPQALEAPGTRPLSRFASETQAQGSGPAPGKASSPQGRAAGLAETQPEATGGPSRSRRESQAGVRRLSGAGDPGLHARSRRPPRSSGRRSGPCRATRAEERVPASSWPW